ncbi:BspA family leucine-rich repeat surface protein [Tamlana sp. I1]|uniref:BspA family leucine-rich repeat surface protein n=1 Tax=Tamlana sp. I1 TaxID=2762061 RepID=UPI00188FC313|nr:BspA family leucine-rich repeat surface protein [Tamlana sp. I1]
MISWSQQLYPANFDVNILNGTNGFVIPGLSTGAKLGAEIQFIGDINNDGLEDFCLGNGDETVNSLDLAGRAYIIFGSATGYANPFDLTSLNGTNGFIVKSIGYDERRGSTVAGPGDINGDGIDDLIVGTSNTTANNMVIYGRTSFPLEMTVNDINGTNGFLIDAPGSKQVAALGDVNNDGINDFIIGTPHWSGQSWIVFGRSSNFPASINSSWLDGINGFRTSDFTTSRDSYKVGGAGDINNDGINDMLIGSWNSLTDPWSYALFGKNTPFDALVDIEAVDGTDGFQIDNTGNSFITFVGPIGDVNNDGIDDCFSESNIIFGSNNPFSAKLAISDLNGTNGFVLANNVICAAPTGDINNDGIDDFIVAGAGDYVVFGTDAGFPSSFDPTTLDGTNGFRIPVSNSNIGRPIDGGRDLNGDGITDFIFGDRATTSDGAVYVIFGGDHYANPLTTHVVRNVTTSGFTFVVNGPETGSIHYAIFPVTTAPVNNYNTILSGTGAVAHGSFLMDTANTDISEVISSLSPDTTYDVYLFLEDAAGNQGEIFSGDNVTTLAEPTAPFITTWQTTTVNESITIPTIGLGNNYTIDWGDGTVDANQTGNASHIYTTAGVHTVSISGDFSRIFFNNSGDKDKILTIEQWGDIAWTSMNRAFYGCTNLNITNLAIDSPDLSLVTDLSFMFAGTNSFNAPLSNWDVSTVENMAFLFSGALIFNQDLNTWDVSAVRSMYNTFNYTFDFNGDITNWDVSNVEDMRYMFAGARAFNQDIGGWNIDSLKYIHGMFSTTDAFNQDVSSWDVSQLTDLSFVFNNAMAFDQNLGAWQIQNATNLSYFFNENALSVANYDATLKAWSAQSLQSGVNFRGGYSKYCTAEAERQSMIDTYGWTIYDKGKVNSAAITPITDVNEGDSYTLPTIAGTNLSGNQKYYTQTGGTGTAYEIGDALNYADFPSYPVTLYAYDPGTGCGASEESFNVTITLTDTTNPTASNPAAVNVQCLADVPAADINVVTDEADDSGIAPTVAYVSDVSDSNTNPETITRTYRIEDSAGNSINVEQIISINDTTNPTASTPASIHVECSSDVPSADILVINDASDNCSMPTVTFISDVSDGNTNPEIITRTYRVTDAAGNSIDLEQIITINDTTNPTASTPASIHVECSGDVPSVDISVISDASDNCSTPTVTFINDVSDGNTNPETITRTYHVEDAAGNSIDVEQIITINDTGDVPSVDISVISDASDNCSTPTVTFINDVSDGNNNPETITRTYRVTDAAGNFIDVAQIITINDTTNPTASTPASIHVECSGDVPSADISVIDDASDNCSTPTVTFISDVSDSNTNPETITRTYRVTDAAGNFIDVAQIISINDTTNPTASTPASIHVQCSGDVPSADILVINDASDNCSMPTVTFISDVSDGNTNPEIITRTYRVTDAAGNSIDLEQIITINDTTNPTASTPASINVQCSGDVPSADISVIKDASDNCSTPIVTFISDVSDGNSNPETITRTYRVTDAAGNFIDVAQIISINDTTNPTASTPASINVQCSGDVPSADILVINDASDNCSTPTVTFINDVSDGNTNPETITRTYRVEDAAGNFINVAQIITINDTTNPTASTPASINVQCSGDVPSADISVIKDASDNCSTPIVTFISDVSDGNSNPETITRTYRVEDAAGNSIDVEQIISINDTTNPTASTPASIHVECSGDVPSADISVIDDSSDNCSTPIVTFISDVSDGNTNPEIITRTYRVEDAAGNFIDVEQIITINDTTNPTVNCVSDFSQYVAANMQTAMVTYAAPVGTDNCSATTTTQIEGLPSGAEFPIGVTTNTFEISDTSGNTVSCSFQVTILSDEDEEELVCTIDAGTDVEIEQGEAAQLEALVSNIGSVVWYPSTGLSNVDILNPIATPTETTSYTVYYTSNQGCTVEDTVTVYVIKKQEDETKYGFSPNGDGVNDYWEIHGIEQYPKNKVSIFNRWGDLVFETEGYNNSSKVFRGIANRKRQLGADALPEGTYFFNIKIEGQHHLKKETGFLVLKR